MRPRSLLTLLLFAALLCVCASERVEAQDAGAVEQAYASYLEADFAAASAALERAFSDRQLSGGELARAHALRAVLLGLGVETSGATTQEAAIAAAVAIDPEVAVPDGAPRALSQRFAVARAAPRARIVLRILEQTDRRMIAPIVENAPDGLVETIEVTCVLRDGQVRRALGEPVEATDALRCDGAAFTAQGQRVLSATLTPPARGGGVLPPRDDTPWIVLGVVAGAVLVGAAIAIGVVASQPGEAMLGIPTVLEW